MSPPGNVRETWQTRLALRTPSGKERRWKRCSQNSRIRSDCVFLAAARPRPEHQTTGPLPQPIATIHLARDDLVVALRRRTPVDRNAHDRDRVSFRHSFFNTHACFEQLTETDAVMG